MLELQLESQNTSEEVAVGPAACEGEVAVIDLPEHVGRDMDVAREVPVQTDGVSANRVRVAGRGRDPRAENVVVDVEPVDPDGRFQGAPIAGARIEGVKRQQTPLDGFF